METNTKPVSNMKKLIAREGLIILGILAFAGLCGLTGALIRQYTKPLPPARGESQLDGFIPDAEPLPLVATNKSKKRKFTEADFQKEQEQIKKPSRLSPAEWAELKALEAEKLANEKFQANRDILVAERDTNLKWAGHFEAAGFLFLLFAYPLYLLVRFITWAIQTLRS